MSGINFATAKTTVETPLIAKYSSWQEYLDDVRKPWIVPNGEGRQYLSATPEVNFGGKPWFHTESFDAAMTMANTGWLEGAERIERLCKSFEDSITSRIDIEEMYLDVTTPYAWDMGAFVTGHPECGINFTKVQTEGTSNKIVRILFSATVSAAVSTDHIIAKGALIAALTRLLELSGRRVELVMAYTVYCKDEPPVKRSKRNRARATPERNRSVSAFIQIKSADQPIDLALMAFQMAHPSSLRRLHFKWLENFSSELLEVIAYRNYGSVGELSREHYEGFDLVIPGSHLLDVGREESEGWIMEQLKAQGVTLHKAE